MVMSMTKAEREFRLVVDRVREDLLHPDQKRRAWWTNPANEEAKKARLVRMRDYLDSVKARIDYMYVGARNKARRQKVSGDAANGVLARR